MNSDKTDWLKVATETLSITASHMAKFEIARRFWNSLGWRRVSFKEGYALIAVWTYLWDIASEYWHYGEHKQRSQLEKLKNAGLDLRSL